MGALQVSLIGLPRPCQQHRKDNEETSPYPCISHEHSPSQLKRDSMEAIQYLSAKLSCIQCSTPLHSGGGVQPQRTRKSVILLPSAICKPKGFSLCCPTMDWRYLEWTTLCSCRPRLHKRQHMRWNKVLSLTGSGADVQTANLSDETCSLGMTCMTFHIRQMNHVESHLALAVQHYHEPRGPRFGTVSPPCHCCQNNIELQLGASMFERITAVA